MKTPEFVTEIFLQPGEFYWGDSDTRIKTLLGSCVALCLWHPHLKIGGMSHSLLPSHPPGENSPPSGRYVEDSFDLFLSEIKKAGTQPRDYQVKIFGGGNMFAEIYTEGKQTIGQKNIEMLRQKLEQLRMPVTAEHLGGKGHRNIIFDLWDGNVWLKHTDKEK